MGVQEGAAVMVTVTGISFVGSFASIELDNGDRLFLSKKDLAGLGLSDGMAVEEEEIYRAVRNCQYPKALGIAVSMLASRPCSSMEIIQKLRRGHFMEEITELVIYKLEKEGLLNDKEFSEQWAGYRCGTKYGRHRIMRELKQKGIPEEMARAAVDAIDPELEAQSALRQAVSAWKKMKPGDDKRKSRQKVINTLIRKGYGWDTAKNACDAAEHLDNS